LPHIVECFLKTTTAGNISLMFKYFGDRLLPRQNIREIFTGCFTPTHKNKAASSGIAA
jgi:hypothetical protein